jgi:WD40 repeat protein
VHDQEKLLDMVIQAHKGIVKLEIGADARYGLTSFFSNMTEVTHTLLHSLRSGHRSTIHCMAFSPGGSLLASGSEDASLIIWDTTKGVVLHRFIMESPILCLVWDPRQMTSLLFGCRNGTAAIIDNFHVGIDSVTGHFWAKCVRYRGKNQGVKF